MGKLNSDADYFVISDAHVGCHTCMDACNYTKLVPFLQDVLDNTNAVLILNGDFFEYSKHRKARVKKTNDEIFRILEELDKNDRLIKLRGNHDEDSELTSKVVNNDIIIFHGDTFGEHTSYFPFFYHFLNLSVALTERVFRMNVNDILKKIFGYDRKKIRKGKMREKAKAYLEKHPEYKSLIVGHSHTPESSEQYYNSGCFVNDESDYIEITNGEIKLKTY